LLILLNEELGRILIENDGKNLGCQWRYTWIIKGEL
jgi:hypothetical protein